MGKKIIRKSTSGLLTFSERVIALSHMIPVGRISTYGALAKAAGGGSMAARSISAILGKAWTEGDKTIPFHRIVYSNGKVWINDEYRKRRNALYKKEKITLDKNDRIVNFRDKLIDFN